MRGSIAILIAGILSPQSNESFAENELTVPVLQAALRTQLESIRSASATYTLLYEPSAAMVKQEGATASTKDCEWASDPPRIFLKQKNRNRQHELAQYFNGKLNYIVRTPLQKDAPPPNINIRGGAPSQSEFHLFLTDAIGGRVFLTEKSLPDLMTDNGCRLLDDEEVEGIRCHKVECDAIDVRPNLPLRVTAWFDPSHDLLPRKIEILRVPNPPGFHVTWFIRDFQPVQAADSALRWFPRVAEWSQAGGVSTLTVTRLSINTRLPDSLFTPDLTPGASVVDISNPAKHRTYQVATERRANERVQKLAAEAKRFDHPPADVPQPSAVPSTRNIVQWIIVGISITCLAGGIALWRMRRT